MVDTPRQPWDQLPNEPDESYARFCTYRNLGPGRSAALAIEVHVEKAKKGAKRCSRPPGLWQTESVKFSWVKRATKWDIHQLQEQGQEMARQWIGGMVLAIQKATAKLTDPVCQPANYLQAIIALEKFAPYLTPDVLQALQPASDTTGAEIPEREFRDFPPANRPDHSDEGGGVDPGPVAGGTDSLPGPADRGTLHAAQREDQSSSLPGDGPLLD